MKTHYKLTKNLRIISVIALLIQLLAVPLTSGTASAAAPPWAYVQIILNRLQASTATTGTICANFSSANITAVGTTSTTLSVVFPSGFTVGAFGTWTINTTAQPDWPSTAVAWPGITAPSSGGVTGQQVSFNIAGASNPTVAKPYCFNWTNTAALTTGSSGNSQTGSMTMASGTYPGSTAQLTSNYAVAIVGAGADQVTVTATVPPIFTFSISGTSQPFTANLSNSAATSTSALNVQVATNAASGYVCYVQDANSKTVTDTGTNPANKHGALTSATAGGYAISNNTSGYFSSSSPSHTLTANTEDYGFAVTTLAQGASGTGTLTDTGTNQYYDSVAATKVGALDPTELRPFASSSGTTIGDTITFVERAEVSGITPAATDYTDVVTIVAAGLF